jgi:hypothetical protein
MMHGLANFKFTVKICSVKREMNLSNGLTEGVIKALNARLNPICHLLALLGAHPILHVSRIRVTACLFRINVKK